MNWLSTISIFQPLRDSPTGYDDGYDNDRSYNNGCRPNSAYDDSYGGNDWHGS